MLTMPDLTVLPASAPIVPSSHCPDDGIEWGADGRCPRCNLERSEVDSLLAAACTDYDAARALAGEGRYTEAIAHAHSARNKGLTHPALSRLLALSSAASGCWEGLVAADLPGEDVPPLEDIQRLYGAACEAARAAQWPEALRHAEDCLALAPWLLPARKLHLLCVQGPGRTDEYTQSLAAALALAPGDADLARWQSAVPLASVSPPPSDSPPRPSQRFGLVGVALAAAALLLGVVLGQHLNPGPAAPALAVVKSVPIPVPIKMAAVKTVSMKTAAVKAAPPALLDDLTRQVSEGRRRADLRQARRWLRSAYQADTANDYPRAIRLADAAARLVPGSPLAAAAAQLSARVSREAQG